MTLLKLLFALLASATLSTAAVTTSNSTANTVNACTKIAALNKFETQQKSLLSIFNVDYSYAADHYWSAANADLSPECVVFPTSAEHISSIVSIITQYDDVQFAVKSGGHNPNVGFSSTNGILIALSSMANTTVSNDKSIAYVQPGSRWDAVVTALEPYNLAAVGGRLGDVGVGGYTIGGGLSFLSAEYGFACDSVVNFEVVLADGSIVNASQTENPDLFFALRGGGNQFGIVTRFDMKTHPIGQVWGGTRIFTGDKAEALINATQEFSENFTDTKAAVIVTGEIAIESLLEIFVVFFFYDGPNPPLDVFAMFNAIDPLEDSTKIQSYADLLTANDNFNLYGLRYLIRGTTLPLLPSPMGSDLLNYHYQTWKKYVITEGASSPDFIFSLAFQPLPVAIAEASLAAGGNAYALDPNAGAHIWMEYDISWLTELGDDHAHSMAMNITNSIDAYSKAKYAGVESVGYVASPSISLEDQQYKPIFTNDAMYDQKPLQSYGNGSYEKLKAINKKYDPNGLWATRTGGFIYD